MKAAPFPENAQGLGSMVILRTTGSSTRSGGVVPVAGGEVRAECRSLQSQETVLVIRDLVRPVSPPRHPQSWEEA